MWKNLAVALCGLVGIAVLLASLNGRAGRMIPHLLGAVPRPAQDLRSAAASVNQIAPRNREVLKPQRLDAWEIIGPGGGGTFKFPAISPHASNLVFVSTDMGQCFVSENGGQTWRQFNVRFTCRIYFDPKRPERVYALAGSGVYRTEDRGRTWGLVYPDPSLLETVRYADDEGETYLQGKGYWPEGVDAFAVDPDDGNTLYLSSGSQLKVSVDAGKKWTTLDKDATAYDLFVDPASPRGKRAVYITNGPVSGVWDGSKYTGKLRLEGSPDRHGAAFGTPSSGAKPVLYTANDLIMRDGQVKGGLLVSDDGGLTWRSLNEGFFKILAKDTYPEFSCIATSRNHAEVVYVSFAQLRVPNDPKAYYGVAKTTDGGATWTIVRKEADLKADNMHDSWISTRFGPDWGDEPLSMAVDDNNPDLVYTADLGRLMRSADGGKNWYSAYSQSTGRGYTTNGLDVTTSYGVHFDPFDKNRMFISYTDIGLFRSEDGGVSWVSATDRGVPRRWWNTTYWVEFDPAVKGKMWAAMSRNHDLPRFRMISRPGAATQFSGGVALSLDGGLSWNPSSKGLPDMAATHIVLDPKSPPSARVLYVTGIGRGVFKSTDGGQTWAARNNGLPGKDPLTWRMALDANGTLYVVTVRRSDDLTYGSDKDGLLFRSRDGADHWETLPLPPGLNGPMGIAVDYRDPQRLYLAAWGRYRLYTPGERPLDGGVFRSTDGGQHWEHVLDASRRIYDVTVDPNEPNVVYAVGSEAAAFRSTDRGTTWTRLGGFNFHAGHRIIPDPWDKSKIYITTLGSSVWHGPAEGDPKAVEDVVSPKGLLFSQPQPKSWSRQ